MEWQPHLQRYNFSKPAKISEASQQQHLNRSGRQLDLQGAASGSGYGCPEGIPVETAIFGLLAAFGVAFGLLYRAVTIKTGGRRKRSLNLPHDDPLQLLSIIADYFWMGKLILK